MRIHVNNINLYYEKHGNGAPLILLHGNGEDCRIFDSLAAKLQKDYTVYSIDSRNHGQSEKTDIYSYETMACDIYQFTLTMNLDRPHLLGFSDGAIISLLIAMKHQESLGKMALLGINLKPTDFKDENHRINMEIYEKTKDPLYKMMLEQPWIEFDSIKHINNPILLVAGEHDIYKPELFSDLAAALPHSALKIMKGHTHESYIVNNDRLYPDLKEFFD